MVYQYVHNKSSRRYSVPFLTKVGTVSRAINKISVACF